MKTSELGIRLIKGFEGSRLHAYKDQGGLLTIGYGSTKGVTEDMVITQDEADERLRDDLAHAEMAVLCQVKVPLTQNQFDSLVSFTYNVGAGHLHDSTLLKKLNLGDYRGASIWFMPWCKIHGIENEGLMHRRHAEMQLFLTPDGT